SLVGGWWGLGALGGNGTPSDSRTEDSGPLTLVETGKHGFPSAAALRHGSSRSFSSLSTTFSIESLIGRGGSVVGGGSSAATVRARVGTGGAEDSQSTTQAGPGRLTRCIEPYSRGGSVRSSGSGT